MDARKTDKIRSLCFSFLAIFGREPRARGGDDRPPKPIPLCHRRRLEAVAATTYEIYEIIEIIGF